MPRPQVPESSRRRMRSGGLAPLAACAATLAAFLVLLLGGCVQEPEGTHYVADPPTVIHTSPADLETGVAATTVVTATFSEAMDPGTIDSHTFILLRATLSGFDTVPGTVTYDAGDSTATFTPHADLLPGQTYIAKLLGGILDAECDTLAPASWSFTTPAPPPPYICGEDPPTVINTTPADLATDVALDGVVTATFSEDMDPGTIHASTFILLRATVFGFDTIPGTVTYDAGSRTATFTPDEDLLPGQTYTARLLDEIADVECDTLAETSWSFTTLTSTPPPPPVCGEDPPTVLSTTPANLETGVAVTTVVTVTFSEAMDPATLTTSTFLLFRATSFGPQAVPGSVTYDASTKTATFTPTANLLPGETYTVTLLDDILDAECDPLAETSWTFSTPPVTPPPPVCGEDPPTVLSTTPANLETGVAVTTVVTVTFNEAMDPATITTSTFLLFRGSEAIPGSVTYDAGTKTATFTPTASLMPGETYTVTLRDDILDAECDPLAETSWTFTTLPEAPPPPHICGEDPPTVLSTTPADFETEVSVTTVVTVTFSEAMDPATINTSTFLLFRGSEAVPGSVTYDAGTKTATFTPSVDLLPDAVYTATLLHDILDAECDPLNETSWTFTTPPDIPPPPPCETDPPFVVASTPADLETDVAVTTVVTATFNIPMTSATINAGTFLLFRGFEAVPGSVTYDASTQTATFTPTASLLPGETYTVLLLEDIQEELCNFGLAETSWTFTTAAESPPP